MIQYFTMITKETIIDFFRNVEEGKDFDTSGKLLWSYYFLDRDSNKLKAFSLVLEKLGMRFKDIFEAEKEHLDDETEYFLQMERIEHHDVDSLDELNSALYRLAEESFVEYYDGFDVGNIISTENIR